MAKRGRKTKSAKTEETTKAEIESATEATPAKESPKHRGRKSQYDADTKAAILKAAAEARDAGKSWAEAWEAAKTAGFKGSLQYLVKTTRDSGAVKIKTRRKKRSAAKTVKPKPGRPAKVAVASAGTGLSSIEKIVAEMVEARVAAAINQAVATLEQATEALRKL